MNYVRVVEEVRMESTRIRSAGKLIIVCLATLVSLSFWVTPALSDEEATAAREVVSKWQDAVVTVKMVIKQRMVVGGREIDRGENETEATATVIDPNGLAVLSLSTTDPAGVFRGMFSERGEDQPKFDWKSEITDLKMILSDGSEVPAKIVLRDKDLDLAFVRPTEKLSKPLPAINLSKDVKPDILDQIVILGRLGKVASRAPSVSLYRIQAIVKKPRTFYITDSAAMESGLGAPVFSLEGKVAGVLLLRVLKSRGIGMGAMFKGMSGMGILPVILPADEIAKAAKQVPKVTDKGKK
jgi:hypothetical protein